MSEAEGPCFYNVPRNVWDAVKDAPASDGYSAAWRAKVAARKAA